ncbi:NAD(P)-binding protein, partial [Cylindrobasidium torrendii FP15055 ss-10]
LLDNGANVVLFSRDTSKLADIPAPVKLETVDYDDEKGILPLFKKHAVDVVICVLAGDFKVLTQTQVGLARAAKEAGVKLFVPNEFGTNTDDHPTGTLLGAKNDAAKAFVEVGIPTLRISTGAFTEFIPWISSTPTRPGKFAIIGKGDTKFSFTAIPDITGYTAHVLTHYPLSALYNQHILLEGQAATLREVAETLGKEIAFVKPEEVENPFVRLLLEFGEKGWCRVGFQYSKPDTPKQLVDLRSGSGNLLWEGHKWKSIADVHKA